MKKFVKTASAMAVVSLFASSAFAVVDMDADSGKKMFATELIGAGTQFANTNAAVAGSALAGDLDVKVKLGFGVSNLQTRYIRLDLAGATFDAAPDLWVDRAGTIAGPKGSNVAIVSSSANKYIFQVSAQADYDQNALVEILMPSITATGSAAPVLSYKLFEDAPSAANDLASGRLASESTEVYGSSPALVWTLAPGSATASVADLYKKFIVSGDTTQTVAELGAITYGVNGTSLHPATGVAAALGDLVTVATNVLVTGDFSAAGANDIFLDTATNDCSTVSVGATVAGGVATLNVGTTGFVGGSLCYNVTGVSPIAKQSVGNGNPLKAALDLTAAAGSTASDVAAATAGEILHDGTTLKASFLNAKSGQKSYVQLVNNGNVVAPFSAQCVTYSGTSASSNNALSVPAGSSRLFTAATLGCPSNTTGVVLTVAVPQGNVIGSVVRENATTGDAATDSLVGNQ